MKHGLNHYPFPKQNPKFEFSEIVFDPTIKLDTNYIDFCYKKNTSVEAVSISNQFFAIEEILLESFLYVMPIERNSSTCSVKFATVIRESCNLIEILFRSIYSKFFIIPDNSRLNIYNFLSLDNFLDFSNIELKSPTLECYHENVNGIYPFQSINNWTRDKVLKPDNIPSWWKSYNNIKHDVESIRTDATLENAIYSLSALFIIIRVIYGDGLICGFLRKYDWQKDEIIVFQIRKSEIFFGEILKLRSNKI